MQRLGAWGHGVAPACGAGPCCREPNPWLAPFVVELPPLTPAATSWSCVPKAAHQATAPHAAAHLEALVQRNVAAGIRNLLQVDRLGAALDGCGQAGGGHREGRRRGEGRAQAGRAAALHSLGTRCLRALASQERSLGAACGDARTQAGRHAGQQAEGGRAGGRTVAGDEHAGLAVLDAAGQSITGEAAKHNRVDGADARARQHGDGQLQGAGGLPGRGRAGGVRGPAGWRALQP